MTVHISMRFNIYCVSFWYAILASWE